MKMNIKEITTLADPALAPFCRLTDHQLRNRLHPAEGLIIVESPKVIRVALQSGYEPVALLCERKHITGDAADIIERIGDAPVYTGERPLLEKLTGYQLTRGVLCAMRRPLDLKAEDICRGKRRVVVINNVVDTTNIGAIFRSAAALGIDAVLLTRNSCDPLNRRSIRVSMGSVFLVPWAWVDEPLNDTLHSLGFVTAAMALRKDSVNIDNPKLNATERLAIIMGTEGDGLPADTIANADFTVCIPMRHNVDSLNVAAASAVAFWQLTKQQ